MTTIEYKAPYVSIEIFDDIVETMGEQSEQYERMAVLIKDTKPFDSMKYEGMAVGMRTAAHAISELKVLLLDQQEK